MTWLVTGGAGYIGAHVVEQLLASQRSVVVLDDLTTGMVSRIPEGVTLEQVTLTDAQLVEHVFKAHEITGVIHLAAKKQVAESVAHPEYYWQENVVGLQNLLDAMSNHGVTKIVYSSSAAVYGQPDIGQDALIDETTHCEPINPYGATKLVGEWLARSRTLSDDFSVAALRYFNVAGAGRPELGDQFEFNLVPIALSALTQGKNPIIFGDDYPTPDGTCIRDYIHVHDLAQAHVSAVEFIENKNGIFESFNIGTGVGSSVREVLKAIAHVTDIHLEPTVAPRRAGDPAQLVASVAKARDMLSWTSTRTLDDIAASAWEAWSRR